MVGKKKQNENKWSTQAVPFCYVLFIAVLWGREEKGLKKGGVERKPDFHHNPSQLYRISELAWCISWNLERDGGVWGFF